MDGKWKRFVIFTRNFAAPHWGFTPRKTNPRRTTTLWLFCILPSARGIDPVCLHVFMSPPDAAETLWAGGKGDFGCLQGLGTACIIWCSWRWCLPEELTVAWRVLQQRPAHTWGQFFGCPQHCRRWMPVSDLIYRFMKFEKEGETVVEVFQMPVKQ